MNLKFSKFVSNDMKMREFYRICYVSFSELKLRFNPLILHISEKNGLIRTFIFF